MPKQIENPGDPWEYVDGLRSKKPANLDNETGNVAPTVTDSGNPTIRIKGVDTRLPGPVRCLAWLATFVAGAATGAVLIASSDPPPKETVAKPFVSEPPPPTSRNTKPARPAPQPSLSDECRRALDGAGRYLSSAANVAEVNDQQIDIITEAYSAILLRDWKELNNLAERQRDLDRKLVVDKAKVLPHQMELREDIATCRSQLSSSTR